MQGFYLYCIRKSGFPFPKAEKTIAGGRVSVISYEGLEAVISEVPLEEFDSQEIQQKAQEDLRWIKEKAQIHEYVIEQAMKKENGKIIPVIPMRFGAIFKNKERVVGSLQMNYQKFKESLETLEGKEEWGVKVFLNEGVFGKTLEERDETILAKKKEIESLPKGMTFFAKKQFDEVFNQEKDKELERITESIDHNLAQLAFNQNKDKLLEKDFTGREEEMILNTFYLIEKSKLAQFREKVEELKEKYNSQGLAIELSGPWPAYHFA